MANIYFSAGAQFFICLVAQIFLWRSLRRPDDTIPLQILWLLVLFLGGPLLLGLTQGLDASVLGLGLGTAYIMTFPAVSAKSPSLLLIDMLSRKGPLTRAEMVTELNSQTALVEDRLRDLKADGLIDTSRAEFLPSRAGLFLGRVFWLYRRMLGLPLGDG